MIRQWFCSASALALLACSQPETVEPQTEEPVSDAAAPANDTVEDGQTAQSLEARLDAVLEAQPDETKARYEYRHPKATLMFFGVEPGMTVVDILPGQPGWYAPILLDYLGPDGKLIGADYSLDLWETMDYGGPQFLENRKTWTTQYESAARDAAGEDGAQVDAFVLGSAPDELAGTVDVVLMIRAAHHLNRFDSAYFTQALEDLKKVLKPGGILGVVQHRAPEDSSDEWAVGNAGYLKQSRLIETIENAGFELVDTSEINANPSDRPTEEDIVWRLPPTLGTSGEDAELRAEMEAIGESDRMTLKFRKPE